MSTASLLVIDNYDSFTFNLVQMFRQYPLRISVHRADKISYEEIDAMDPDYILVSPGPKDPAAAGISLELIRRYYRRIPIFGVCLGMQCMNEAFGGITVRAPLPLHGKISLVKHEGRGLFAGVPNPVTVARYHSLAVANISDELEVTATAGDGVVMGLSHRRHPLHGVQFHPESFLTESGFCFIENFLRLGPLDNHLRSQAASAGRSLKDRRKSVISGRRSLRNGPPGSRPVEATLFNDPQATPIDPVVKDRSTAYS